MTTPAAPVAPSAAPAVGGAQPQIPPPAQKAPTAPKADPAAAREAEYQAALAAARGKAPPTKGTTQRDERGQFKAPAAAPEPRDDQGNGAENDHDLEQGAETDAQAPKVEKLKVNGKEVEFDFSDEAAVRREVQKGLAAQQKFDEAAKATRTAQAFIQKLLENPFAVLEHPAIAAKINVREAAEKYLYGKMQRDQMTPEQIQAEKDKADLDRFRESEQQRELEAKQQERENMKQDLRQRITKDIIAALDASGDLPATDWTVQRMGYWMKVARQQGLKHITAKDVVEHVRNDFTKMQRDMFSKYSDEQLVQILGKEGSARVRRAELARMTKNPHAQPGARPVQRQAAPERRFGSAEEMRDDAIARAKRGA